MKTRFLRRIALILGITVSLVIAATVPLPAQQIPAQQQQDALTVELAEVAKEIGEIVQAKGGGPVTVGAFSTSSEVRGHVGPQIQRILAAQFRGGDVPVDPIHYRYEIRGEYLAMTDTETGLLGVKLVCRLIERENGDVIAERPTGRFIFGAETVPRMLGLTVHSSPNQDALERSEAFKQAMQKSAACVIGTLLRADPSSPYGVELVVKRGENWTGCPWERDDRESPLAKLTTGDVIGIRLINDSNFAAAVNLTLDGINTLSTAREPKSEYWLVPAKDQLIVKGWWISDSESRAFRLNERPESETNEPRFGPTHGQRMITAAFSAAWREDSDRPRDEAYSRCTGPVVATVESNSPTLRAAYQIGGVRDVLTFLIDTESMIPTSTSIESPAESPAVSPAESTDNSTDQLELRTMPEPRSAKNFRGLRDGSVRIEILRGTETGYESRLDQTESYGSQEVALFRGEPFAFKVVNSSEQDMAVRLSFDGVNVLAFGERGRMVDYLVVRAHCDSIVTGWTKGDDLIPFIPRTLPKSDRVIVNQSIPRIHATFAETWTNGINLDRNSTAAQVEYQPTASGQKAVRWIGPIVKILEADYSEVR